MENKLRTYIDAAFEGVVETQKVRELKEEILANLLDKYNEQLALGCSEANAYGSAVAGLGDLSELVESVRVQPLYQPGQRDRKRHAAIQAIAIILYILCVVPLMIFAVADGSDIAVIIGTVIMFVMIAIATGLLIYDHNSRPVYVKQEETVVEDFKEWRTTSPNSNWKKTYKTFSGAFWCLVVCVYLIASFTLHIWGWSWIIFIAAAAVENIVKGLFQLREDK